MKVMTRRLSSKTRITLNPHLHHHFVAVECFTLRRNCPEVNRSGPLVVAETLPLSQEWRGLQANWRKSRAQTRWLEINRCRLLGIAVTARAGLARDLQARPAKPRRVTPVVCKTLPRQRATVRKRTDRVRLLLPKLRLFCSTLLYFTVLT